MSLLVDPTSGAHLPPREERETPAPAARNTVDARLPVLVPRRFCEAVLRRLDGVADRLVAAGVSANAVTIGGVVIAAVAGALLAIGSFGLATAAMTLASLGDAVDGLVARRSRSASVSGGLLDASVDRYEEFFFFGGMAVLFRDSPAALLLTLAALAGSYMVSYGSAKAEALAIPVPGGGMRRAERAICLCVGAAAAAVVQAFASRNPSVGPWVARAPLVAAVALIAAIANVSAIRRLRAIAAAAHARARSAFNGPGR